MRFKFFYGIFLLNIQATIIKQFSFRKYLNMESQQSYSEELDHAINNRLLWSNEEPEYVDSEDSLPEDDSFEQSEHDTQSEQSEESETEDEAASTSSTLFYLGKDNTKWYHHPVKPPKRTTTIRLPQLTTRGKEATTMIRS